MSESHSLDRRVADAIGLEAKASSRHGDETVVFYRNPEGVVDFLVAPDSYVPMNVPYRRFNPSVDLNRAFWAAQQVGLFDDDVLRCYVERYEGDWYVRRKGYRRDDKTVHVGVSLPDTICEAILALTEQKPSDALDRKMDELAEAVKNWKPQGTLERCPSCQSADTVAGEDERMEPKLDCRACGETWYRPRKARATGL